MKRILDTTLFLFALPVFLFAGLVGFILFMGGHPYASPKTCGADLPLRFAGRHFYFAGSAVLLLGTASLLLLVVVF